MAKLIECSSTSSHSVDERKSDFSVGLDRKSNGRENSQTGYRCSWTTRENFVCFAFSAEAHSHNTTTRIPLFHSNNADLHRTSKSTIPSPNKDPQCRPGSPQRHTFAHTFSEMHALHEERGGFHDDLIVTSSWQDQGRAVLRIQTSYHPTHTKRPNSC
mmetsp:Transcript_3433/g.13059  ORF Transcript_3433/g.13059 Transcript_3433/m.13059 type:complete len:158 (+) Transcript_3433:1992-2465(+)